MYSWSPQRNLGTAVDAHQARGRFKSNATEINIIMTALPINNLFKVTLGVMWMGDTKAELVVWVQKNPEHHLTRKSRKVKLKIKWTTTVKHSGRVQITERFLFSSSSYQ